mmetsp:Transcript_93625/g.140442  ORF Transcript_93625/g.140442 Transcript_93625/m.140442 type:complete len:121 (-) Transcript_93625:22-384(-)
MSLAEAVEKASNEFRKAQKELETLIQGKQQYLTQKHENDMVLQELKLLGDDAQVFKLVGPAMVKKDTKESITNVQTRLDLINRELERIEKRQGDVEKNVREAKDKVMQLQQIAEAQKQKK